MGFSVDWVSLAGLGADEALARLGLLNTGEEVDYPPRDGYMWGVTPDGRVLIVTDDYGEFTVDTLAMLSQGASLVAARAEGNDCTTSIWGYENGQELWSAVCGSEDEADPRGELVTSGRLPPEYQRSYARSAAEHRDGEELRMAWVALDIASELTGWGPESEIGSDLKFFVAARQKRSGGVWPAKPVNKLWFAAFIGVVAALILFQIFRS